MVWQDSLREIGEKVKANNDLDVTLKHSGRFTKDF